MTRRRRSASPTGPSSCATAGSRRTARRSSSGRGRRAVSWPTFLGFRNVAPVTVRGGVARPRGGLCRSRQGCRMARRPSSSARGPCRSRRTGTGRHRGQRGRPPLPGRPRAGDRRDGRRRHPRAGGPRRVAAEVGSQVTIAVDAAEVARARDARLTGPHHRVRTHRRMPAGAAHGATSRPGLRSSIADGVRPPITIGRRLAGDPPGSGSRSIVLRQ